MLFPRIALALAFCVGISATEEIAAQDPSTPAIKRAAVVDGDVVTLGDLVEPCGRLCATPLFRAPAPGETGVIQAARVVAAAREAGLPFVDARAFAQIVVTRTGRPVAREDIDAALAQAIAQRVSAEAEDLSIMLDQTQLNLSMPARGAEAPAIADLIIDARARRFTASVTAPQGGGSLRVSGSYVETVATPVLTRAVQRGEAISDADIAIERRDRASFGEEGPIAAKLAVGRVARSTMRAGTPLRDRDLAKPLLVERNTPVQITLQSGALHITLKGKAMESGALGDVIGVQNLSSKRVLQGVVIGPGLARIQHGEPPVGRTAMQQSIIR